MPKSTMAIIRDEVREFYAEGVKSGNKVYMKSGGDMVTNEAFEAHRQKWTTRMFAGWQSRKRNRNAPLSRQHRPVYSDPTTYDFGERIWNGGARAEFRSGNCGEMAAVSAYRAVSAYGYLRRWAYLGVISAPGDHVFCILSMNTPTWATAGDMTGVAGASGAYIIDPWLNTACSAEEYWANARAKLRKWHSDGKRVCWDGGVGAWGWYDPGGTYQDTFRTAPIVFQAV